LEVELGEGLGLAPELGKLRNRCRSDTTLLGLCCTMLHCRQRDSCRMNPCRPSGSNSTLG